MDQRLQELYMQALRADWERNRPEAQTPASPEPATSNTQINNHPDDRVFGVLCQLRADVSTQNEHLWNVIRMVNDIRQDQARERAHQRWLLERLQQPPVQQLQPQPQPQPPIILNIQVQPDTETRVRANRPIRPRTRPVQPVRPRMRGQRR